MAKTTPVHVEVCLKLSCCAENDLIREETMVLLEKQLPIIRNGNIDFSESNFLKENIESILIEYSNDREDGAIPFWQAEIKLHIYQLNDEPASEDQYGENETSSACAQLILPATCLHGLWESLIYDSDIKNLVLEYASTAMLFASKRVDWNIISWNRVVLFHGPPGTGKTSLCKAVAQKLSIRLNERYPISQLVEINAHSLFSKWFSESGKLVMALFQHLHDLIEDSESFVCVLIDEVESLTAARKAAFSGSEPSDAIRVVNALLTQIDTLKTKENVLVLTTSNITEAIDLAFVDRADMKLYIGLPSLAARYSILRSCLLELVRVGIISPAETIQPFLNLNQSSSSIDKTFFSTQSFINSSNPPTFPSVYPNHNQLNMTFNEKLLVEIAEKANGMSGRALRKLPIQAHSSFIQTSNTSLNEFLKGLAKAVDKEHEARSHLIIDNQNKSTFSLQR